MSEKPSGYGRMDVRFPVRTESAHLVLCPYRKEDAGTLYRFISEERDRLGEVLASPVLAVDSLEAAEELVSRLEDDWRAGRQFVISVWHRIEDRLVGECYLGQFNPDRWEADVGIFVLRDFEGRGLAREALEALIRAAARMGLSTLHYRCDADNARSHMLASRCGFSVADGPFSLRVRRDGASIETIHYRLDLPIRSLGRLSH
jgi:RimJ/RimL family protein N-acetyltransferase